MKDGLIISCQLKKIHFFHIDQEIDKDKENTKVSDEKNQLFMKFLTKVDERDVDERAKPGGDVRYYLNDLKYKTRQVKIIRIKKRVWRKGTTCRRIGDDGYFICMTEISCMWTKVIPCFLNLPIYIIHIKPCFKKIHWSHFLYDIDEIFTIKFKILCSFIILLLHNMLYKMNFHITGYMYVMEHSAIVLVKMKFKDISFFLFR